MHAMLWWDWNNPPAEVPAPEAAGDEGPDSLQNCLLTVVNTAVQVYVGEAAEEGRG